MGCFSKRRASVTSNDSNLVQLLKDLRVISLDRIERVTGTRPKNRPFRLNTVVGKRNNRGNYIIPGTNQMVRKVGDSTFEMAVGSKNEYSREMNEALIHDIAHLWITLGAKKVGGDGRYEVSHPDEFEEVFLRWHD